MSAAQCSPRKHPLAVGILLLAALALTSCEKASSPSAPVGPVALQLTPTSATVQVGRTQQFSVTGFAVSDVTWSVDPATAGTIDASGRFTATAVPTSGTCAVVATLKSDPTRVGLATVIVTPAPVTNGYPTDVVTANGGLQTTGSVEVQSVVQENVAPMTATTQSGSMTVRYGFYPSSDTSSP